MDVIWHLGYDRETAPAPASRRRRVGFWVGAVLVALSVAVAAAAVLRAV